MSGLKRQIALVLMVWALTAAAYLALPSPAFAQSARALNRQGIQAYKETKYDNAAEAFKKAQEKAPDNLLLDYNEAAALAAAKKTDDSLKTFGKVEAARDPDLAARAKFAEGVIQYQQAQEKAQANDLEKAVQNAKAAVAANQAVLMRSPADNDARVNFELADRLREELEKKLKQQQQQQQQQNDKQDKQNKDQQKQDQQKQDQQDKQKQDEQKKEQEQQKQDQQKNQQQDQQPGNATPSPTPTPQPPQKQNAEQQQKDQEKKEAQQPQAGDDKKKEDMKNQDAASVLNLLEDNDVDALKRMLKMRYGRMQHLDKDW